MEDELWSVYLPIALKTSTGIQNTAAMIENTIDVIICKSKYLTNRTTSNCPEHVFINCYECNFQGIRDILELDSYPTSSACFSSQNLERSGKDKLKEPFVNIKESREYIHIGHQFKQQTKECLNLFTKLDYQTQQNPNSTLVIFTDDKQLTK